MRVEVARAAVVYRNSVEQAGAERYADSPNNMHSIQAGAINGVVGSLIDRVCGYTGIGVCSDRRRVVVDDDYTLPAIAT